MRIFLSLIGRHHWIAPTCWETKSDPSQSNKVIIFFPQMSPAMLNTSKCKPAFCIFWLASSREGDLWKILFEQVKSMVNFCTEIMQNNNCSTIIWQVKLGSIIFKYHETCLHRIAYRNQNAYWNHITTREIWVNTKWATNVMTRLQNNIT